MKKILIISLVLHAILVWMLAPWMKTRMEFDTAKEAERTEEVRKRELARQEHDRLKRERQRLDEKTALKLKKDLEKTKKAKLERQVDELRKLRDEILERQQRELAQLRERQEKDIIANAQVTFTQQAEDLKEHVAKFIGNVNRRSFVVGGYQNGYERSAKGLLDSVVIHRAVLAPPFEGTPVHRFAFDGDLKDAVTGREGFLDREAELVNSPSSGGQALSGNGVNSRAEFWPIDFGDAFTIIVSASLKPKTERPQLLFANSHSGENNRGFRVSIDPTAADATAGQVVLSTSGEKAEGQEVRSHPGAFGFGAWHEVAVAIDKSAGTARIYIDGRDVTAPGGSLAADFFSGGTTIDGSEMEMAEALAEHIERDAPSPDNAEVFKKELEEIQAKLDQRMEETPDLHDVRGEITESKRAAEAIAENLDALAEKTDLATMNDTSESVADKLSPQAAPANATPAELYQEASEIEAQISEAYADVNAAAKAVTENQSFAETREETRAYTPDRPDLANQLAEHEPAPGTVGELDEFRDNLDRATNEVNDMASRARGLLGTADNRSLTQSREFSGSAFSSSSARLAAARSQNSYGAVVDMTGMGSGDGDSQGMRGDFSGEGANMAASDGKQKTISLDQGAIMAKALPGRRFTEKSLRSGWLYLDTWYVIGPWENRGSIDFDVKHPPEEEIDFDAVYRDGKFSDRPDHPQKDLRWQFYQSDSVRCQPPEVSGASTYYAHTEVWFENDRDMLIAVASDDAASVWLNDQIIWQDRGQSSWNLGEGYRRVHFRKGYNKMLVRIENGPVHCVWSVLLCPPEVMK
ncbi:hypothetical protein [Luteolibacter marinus]|uniref:hypothetical protein n=1 Tax=Luteolibacter marinus TaxID=2776705 RepID=UPI0018687A03|nr:hypothetical protein [Luteolibacter marinus]